MSEQTIYPPSLPKQGTKKHCYADELLNNYSHIVLIDDKYKKVLAMKNLKNSIFDYVIFDHRSCSHLKDNCKCYADVLLNKFHSVWITEYEKKYKRDLAIAKLKESFINYVFLKRYPITAVPLKLSRLTNK